MVVCGKRGDCVYSGRGSAGPSHTFTRGFGHGGRGVPGYRQERQPSRCALLACSPAFLSTANAAAAAAAATARQPARRSAPRGPAAALRLAPHRRGSSSRGTIDSARRA